MHAEFPSTGRRVLVTGAADGLGRALAREFAAAGDRVAVHYGSRRAQAEETLALLPAVEAGAHALLGGDLSDAAEPPRLVAAAVESLGGLDILVNNAAVNLPHPPVDTSYAAWTAAWQQHTAVNLLGTAGLAHQAAARMIAQGRGGRIVNIGSRGAFRGEPDHPAYGATKAAVHALGQSLALALAPYGIAVSSVAPGFIETPRVADRLGGEAGEAVRAQSPFGRVAQPEEVAAAVAWLASPAGEWSSGAVLDLNGASYLRT
ncbi:SDR family NAD(P)-dependent oxidoreductase [Streptomyces sulphureus]|uniref:SDR family NAD(P)-dependent oxidoreductase n=1 Tax=Streptomyces sulphureus TaxID=47758 RepID=UPI00035E9579|nr:SDR family oxidoreductase [Streptomyces sulphureus]